MAYNPYSTALASGEIDYDFDSSLNPSGQMKKYKKEEDAALAPDILPEEFQSLPENIATMIENAHDASRILNNVLKMADYADKKDLMTLQNNLQKVVYYFTKNTDQILGKYTIGYKGKD